MLKLTDEIIELTCASVAAKNLKSITSIRGAFGNSVELSISTICLVSGVGRLTYFLPTHPRQPRLPIYTGIEKKG